MIARTVGAVLVASAVGYLVYTLIAPVFETVARVLATAAH